MTRSRGRITAYLDRLEREIVSVAAEIGGDRPVVQLHWGGGSPSCLNPDEIRRLGQALRAHFALSDTLEASVEVDPRGVTEAQIQAFAEVGFNRVSLGVQDVNPRVQLAVNRLQPFQVTERVADWFKDAGFRSLNIDLIYGLPYQKLSSWPDTLAAGLSLNPDRVAVFNYAHVPWLKRHQSALPVHEMPSADERLRMLEQTIDQLTAAEYQFIGMDHFAKRDDELAIAQRRRTLWRNFQGYTTHAGVDLVGLGLTSLGMFQDAYYQNERDLKAYLVRVDRGEIPILRGLRLNDDDRARRQVIMSLMCHYQVKAADIEAAYDVDFWRYFDTSLDSLDQLQRDGLVQINRVGVFVTTIGRLMIRNIAMVFDRYLASTSTRFSSTI